MGRRRRYSETFILGIYRTNKGIPLLNVITRPCAVGVDDRGDFGSFVSGDQVRRAKRAQVRQKAKAEAKGQRKRTRYSETFILGIYCKNKKFPYQTLYSPEHGRSGIFWCLLENTTAR